MRADSDLAAPPSTFTLWIEEEGRAFVLAHYPEASDNEVKRRCKQVWEGLEADTKLMYMKKHKTAMTKWRADKSTGVFREKLDAAEAGDMMLVIGDQGEGLGELGEAGGRNEAMGEVTSLQGREGVLQNLVEERVLTGARKESDGIVGKDERGENTSKEMARGRGEGEGGEGVENLEEVDKPRKVSKKIKLTIEKREKTERYEIARNEFERGNFKSLRYVTICCDQYVPTP